MRQLVQRLHRASLLIALVGGALAMVGAGPTAAARGFTWSTPSIVDPSGHTVNVTCVSPKFCLATGQTNEFVYNGATWSAAGSLGAPAVAGCASSHFCVAGEDNGDVYQYNGKSWTAGHPLDSAAITGVSCVTRSFCAAVSGSGHAYVLTFSGWSAAALVMQSGQAASSVSCTLTNFCVAAGASGVSTFDGQSWSTPAALAADPLSSVSCAPNTQQCVAVGVGGSVATRSATGIWSTTTLGSTSFVGVSCASVALCAAYDVQGGAYLAQSGVWGARVGVFGPSGIGASISCPRVSLCLATSGSGTVSFARKG